MGIDKSILKDIPKVDEVLAGMEPASAGYSHAVVLAAVRETLENLREGVLAGEVTAIPELSEVISLSLQEAERNSRPSLRRVVNATGIILHTNLGRAPLANEALKAVCDAAAGYSTLEYDYLGGERGSRYSHVENLICELTGAESAVVVNNNASAVMLMLSTMVKGRETVISRGEIVEIGGAFRVHAIMEQSGSILVEVGTTNKTHLSDYESAITPETGALLKVHTSNYKIMGFSSDVSLDELVTLGRKAGVPVIYDLGSGALINLEQFGILDEPDVVRCLASGVDVLSFSGDKLLGGPQAGIILGKKQYIDRMKKNPLTRAVRIDKMTLAALEATLRLYRDPKEAMEKIPTLSMLAENADSMRGRAERMCGMIASIGGYSVEVVTDEGQVGGGSVPTQMLMGYAVAVTASDMSPDRLEAAVRTSGQVPVVGRISKDRFLLGMRTVREDELEIVAEAFRAVSGVGK